MVVMQSIGTEEPYRQLFLQLSHGAARCRVIADQGRLLDVEVVEDNAAFAPYRDLLPGLLDVIAEGRRARATCELRTGQRSLAITVLPCGADEVMVLVEDVTARADLEQRVREAQNRFAQAFHGNAAAMVIAQKSDLRILDVNPRWLDLFDATREEVIGRTAVELGLITEDRAATRITQHRAFSNGYDSELELATRSGSSVVVLASARDIEMPEGHCTLTTLIDITGRKRAEEAFALAFRASPAAMMLVEVSSDRIVEVNPRLLEITGLGRTDLVNRRSSQVALTLWPPREQLVAEVVRAGRLDGVEILLASTSGRGVWTLASTEVVTLRGKPHRLSVFTDISARKRLERHLVARHLIGYSLAEASDLDAAIPPILAALCRDEDWGGGSVWFADDALRCRGTWCDPDVGDTAAAVLKALAPAALWAELRATGAAMTIAPAPGCRALVVPILRGDAVLGMVVLVAAGAPTPLDAEDRGLYDSIGRLLGMFVERARAEASLRELNSELEGRVAQRTRALEVSNRDLAAFGSSVSHDLRAPLRAIHGFSQILLEDFGAALPEEARGLLGRILGAGARMQSLIDGLLSFSQLGRGSLVRSRIDCDALVRSVVDELLVGREVAARLDLQLDPLGACWADPALVRAVWTNLIDNALKYARDRERVVVGVGRDVRAGEVVYHVTDNGVGFDMAHAGRLFGAFQRLHSGFEGVGIGLANVRRIVELHEGWITAESQPDRGSRFTFSLGPEQP